jgi:hypothetical protein
MTLVSIDKKTHQLLRQLVFQSYQHNGQPITNDEIILLSLKLLKKQMEKEEYNGRP